MADRKRKKSRADLPGPIGGGFPPPADPSIDSLKYSERIFRKLAHTSRDVIYAVDTDGVLRFVSEQVSLYGFTREEMTGRPFLDFMHEDDRERIMTEFSYSIETGEEFPSRFRLVNSAGDAFWFEDVGTLQTDGDGRTVGMMGVLRDITERAHSERERAE